MCGVLSEGVGDWVGGEGERDLVPPCTTVLLGEILLCSTVRVIHKILCY